MKIKLFLIFPVFFFINISAQTVNVTDYGATPNSASNDDTAGVRAAIAACQNLSNPVLFFPTGTYHLDSEAESGTYFFINGIDNLTIEGSGSTIMFLGAGYDQGTFRHVFRFWNCKNLKIQNINTDHNNPPFSQTEVVNVGSEFMDLRVFDGFSMLKNSGDQKAIRKYAEYDITTGQQTFQNRHTWDAGKTWSWVDQSQNIIRMQIGTNFTTPVGGHILLRHSVYDGSTYNFGKGCEDVVLTNINVYKACGYPYYANDGTNNISMINCGVRKSSPDMWATATADGIHFLDVRGEVIVDNCHIESQLDDGLNLHSFLIGIDQAINSNTLIMSKIRSFHTLEGYRVGDVIEFYDRPTKQIITSRVVSGISNYSTGAITLEFTEDLPNFTEGITNVVAANISIVGSLHVKNSTFKGNRARGVLVSSRSGTIIENCTFDRNLIGGVLFELLDRWVNGPAAKNVVVRNNVFDGCNYGANSRRAGVYFSDNAEDGTGCNVFENISITGNTFKNSPESAIDARHVSGLEIRDNIVESFTSDGDAITYGNSKNVVIENNTNVSIVDRGGNCPDDAVIDVTGITVTPPTATLGELEALQLTVTVSPADAKDQSVTWSSSDSLVASVDLNGLVTAVAVGSPVTITATTADGGFTDTSIITVSSATPEGVISISGPTEVFQGETITVNVAYSATTTRDIIVYLQENGVDLNSDGNDYSAVGTTRFIVSAGEDTASIGLTADLDAPLSDTYRYTAFLTTTPDGGWTERLGTDTVMPGVSVVASLSTSSINKQRYSVYPNPAGDFIQVAIPNTSLSNVQFRMYDMLGQLVLEAKADASKGHLQIDVSSLSQGIHVLEITVNDQVMHHKLIKK